MVATAATAQSSERHVISSNGNSVKTPTVQLDQTMGELIIQTGIQGTVILTQGFNQPDDATVDRTAALEVLKYSVYPVPTNSMLNIELNSDIRLAMSVSLLDLNGSAIRFEKKTTNGNSGTKFSWDIGKLSAGTYILRIESQDGAWSKSEKIIKLGE